MFSSTELMKRKGVVVITGGGSGIGRLCARNHAEQGCNVAILDVNEKGMHETAYGYPTISCYNVD